MVEKPTNDVVNESNGTKKKPSAIENFGKVSMNVGNKIGNMFTEFFTGKPPTEEEKKRRVRLRELKSIQEEAQFQRDLQLAREGKWVAPEQPKKEKKKMDWTYLKIWGNIIRLKDLKIQILSDQEISVLKNMVE
jgi:hypothetical protein